MLRLLLLTLFSLAFYLQILKKKKNGNSNNKSSNGNSKKVAELFNKKKKQKRKENNKGNLVTCFNSDNNERVMEFSFNF